MRNRPNRSEVDAAAGLAEGFRNASRARAAQAAAVRRGEARRRAYKRRERLAATLATVGTACALYGLATARAGLFFLAVPFVGLAVIVAPTYRRGG